MLDIGCNDGYFMRHFDWKFQSYIGVDMFPITNYLHTSDIFQYTKNGKIRFLTGLFEDMTFDHKFDFIFAGEIIEHVMDVKKFLKNIELHLADNGRLCLTTPNGVGIDQPEHYRQYRKKSLYHELQRYFEVIKIEELPRINESWPFLYAKCKKNL